jgi:hypothetical protein
LLLDLHSYVQDFGVSAMIDLGGCQVGQSLGVTVVVVVIDKGADLSLKTSG